MSDVIEAPQSVDRPVRRPRALTRELWQDRLDRFKASGLTVAQFCAQEAVSVPSFYSWKRQLAAQATSPNADAPPALPLVPVRLQPSGPVVELVLTNGTLLRLVPGCDPAWVRALVAALGGAAC